MKFEEFVQKTNSVKTKDELFAIYEKSMKDFGLDKLLFCLVTDHKDIGEDPKNKFRQNFPRHWMEHYFSERLDLIDPVPLYGITQAESYSWEDIPKKMPLVKKQVDCLQNGEESGLYNAISMPLRGPNGAVAGVSLASSEKRDSFEANQINRDLITAMGHHFYLVFRRLGEEEVGKKQVANYYLTQKEYDILCWMAMGKTNPEIADICNISLNTVSHHTKNIMNKLGVHNRMLAVITAITNGLIQP